MSKRRRVDVGRPDQYAGSGSRIYDLQDQQLSYHTSTSNNALPPTNYLTGNVDPASDLALESDINARSHTSSTGPLVANVPYRNSGGQQEQWDDPPQQTYPMNGYAGSSSFSHHQQSQQPYFSPSDVGYAQQRTDPSTYNAPWPPSTLSEAQSESFVQQQTKGQYGTALGSSQTMPYLGAPSADMEVGFQGAMEGYSGQHVQVPEPQGFLPDVGSGNGATVFHDASMQLKNQSLSILDNLATQLIQTTAKLNLTQMQEILHGDDTEESQSYKTLKSLFEQTRKVYCRDTPFVDAIAIQMFQPNQQEIIRKANIATFISSILGAHDVGFYQLNEFFMETFVPLGHRLLKWQGAIYLDLKTQAYISALINSDGNPSHMLDELFPPDLDAQILTRHPDAPSLSPSEQDFIDRCRARKSYLLAEGNAETAPRELAKKYQWSEFVREFASCISKNVDAIMNAPIRNNSLNERRSTLPAAEFNPPMPSFNSTTSTSAGGHVAENDHPRQPSSVAATASSGTNAPRQPWTKHEEDALLSGLARVNGPHWSQILALYGRGGSVSEVLKDRNQVQLKDKARNLKLAYLKNGREVPAALKGVTGELGKRGGKGARAALGDVDMEDEAVDGDVGGGREKGGGSARRRTKKGS